MVSEANCNYNNFQRSVLILVVVEDGLREKIPGKYEYHKHQVLILVVVEDGLRDRVSLTLQKGES